MFRGYAGVTCIQWPPFSSDTKYRAAGTSKILVDTWVIKFKWYLCSWKKVSKGKNRNSFKTWWGPVLLNPSPTSL